MILLTMLSSLNWQNPSSVAGIFKEMQNRKIPDWIDLEGQGKIGRKKGNEDWAEEKVGGEVD